MHRTLRALPAIAILMRVAAAEPAQDRDPWIGTWKLEASEGRDTEGPYSRVEFRVEPLDRSIRVIYDMVGIRGGRSHLEWVGAFDGRDYAVQGVDYVLTNAYTPVDDRSYTIVVKVDGQMAATTAARVSEEGDTLTAVTTERDSRGNALTTTSTYRRQ